MALTTEQRKEMQRKNDELFKKYKPQTLRLPNGSSIVMDNKEGFIRECKRLGIEYKEPQSKIDVSVGNTDSEIKQEETDKPIESAGTTEGTIEDSTITEKKDKAARRGRPKKA